MPLIIGPQQNAISLRQLGVLFSINVVRGRDLKISEVIMLVICTARQIVHWSERRVAEYERLAERSIAIEWST